MSRDVFIAVPAWGNDYVGLAIRFTIPAICMAIDEWNPRARVRFVVHTDHKQAMRQAIPERHSIDFMNVVRGSGPGNWPDWRAFERAHRDAIQRATPESLLVLLNADIVVSRETMRVVDAALQGKIKVGVSVGIRTLADGNSPPLGVSAEALSDWIWAHRHKLTNEAIWGAGRYDNPTVIYFPHDKAHAEVSMHCFHLTPMFMVKDDRFLDFAGTIDDNLLQNYADDEVVFFKDHPFSIAELSSGPKDHPCSAPMNLKQIIPWAKQQFGPAQVRNFSQRFAVRGHPKSDHPAAAQIIKALSSRR